jgi:hypothetical protein
MTANSKNLPLPAPKEKEQAQQVAATLREEDPKLAQPAQPRSQVRIWVDNTWQTVTKPVRFVKNLLLANPREFHGKHYVTGELEEHSQLTARVISVGSLFNAITNQPLLFFAFKDFGGGPAVGASVVLNLLIVKFTNDNGTAVAGRKRKNLAWSRAGAATMVAMSVLQSVAAGVGMEAMNNRPQLARMKAENLIAEKTQKIQEIPATTEEARKAREAYERERAKLDRLDKSDPEWDTTYVKLYGRWSERNKDWSQVETENLPLKQRMLRLEKRASQQKRQAQKEWNKKLAKRGQIGDDVLFLQQELPQLFQRHFNDSYQLTSGTETVRLAALNLYDKLKTGDVAGLGFPMFFALLSVVTSGAACLLTLTHAQREDVAMSRDAAVGEAIDAYFEYLIAAADDGESEAESPDD